MQSMNQFEKKLPTKQNAQQVGIIDPELQYDYSKLTENQNQIQSLLANPGKTVTVIKSSQEGQNTLYSTRSNENFTHQLIQMVHYSYYNHYPLCFSPDNIQLMISQGFCAHIKQNVEKFRKKFVQHEGQLILKVIVGMDYTKYDWPNIISKFSELIKQHVNEDKFKLCVHKYSTTDQIAQTCYEVSLMDTMQKYFKYILGAGCGISKIKLLGTLEDWIKLKENTEKLREFELDWWIDKLIPILDQFIQLYQGNVDVHFWKNIYRFIERDPMIYEPTPEFASGWITYFFPYKVNESASIHDKNKFVKNDFSSKDGKFLQLTAKQIPSGISQAPVEFQNQLGQKVMDLEFNAGYVGVGKDEEGFLYCQQGWAITKVEDLKKQKMPPKKEKQQIHEKPQIHEKKQIEKVPVVQKELLLKPQQHAPVEKSPRQKATPTVKTAAKVPVKSPTQKSVKPVEKPQAQAKVSVPKQPVPKQHVSTKNK